MLDKSLCRAGLSVEAVVEGLGKEGSSTAGATAQNCEVIGCLEMHEF